MDISIDLRYFRQISFGNHEIEKEMFLSWKEDSFKRISDLQILLEEQNQKNIFNSVHALKTNFSMVDCYAGIKFCELLIDKIQKDEIIDSPALRELDCLINKIIESFSKI